MQGGLGSLLFLAVALAASVLAPGPARAHPLGNFSISHYTALRVEPDRISVSYIIDMAEIPTFQELHAKGLVPDPSHPLVASYLRPAIEALATGLQLEVNGTRLILHVQSSGVAFPPGAGDLPTMKMEAVYEASLDRVGLRRLNELHYWDENFAGRAGWKEIVAVAGPRTSLATSSVPEHDRSQALTDYPTDLLDSPPQDVEARLLFSITTVAAAATSAAPSPFDAPAPARRAQKPTTATVAPGGKGTTSEGPTDPVWIARENEPAIPVANRQPTPRSVFTQLVTAEELSFGVIVLALITALGVGAAHALEPGHGKAVVAAYLVGSRGTAWHAVFLGLVVTAAHTAGVFLLGLVTLYASRFMVPERLYPWLGAASGLTIAGLGAWLFLKRYAGREAQGHHHTHCDDHRHAHEHHHDDHRTGQDGHHDHHDQHDHHHHAATSLRQLFALGITGGVVPCPAALVVLLSAIALRRTGFGLLLIVAFSLGLASVLIAIGLLMVYARRFMARVHGDGPMVRRWLPLTSAAIITVLGVTIAIQALISAGIVQVRL
jgi:ABC-type nickel/cobalt efflux system permease component RcnA